MKRLFLLFGLLQVLLPSMAQNSIEGANPMYGQDTVNAEFFRKWYHQGNFVHYIEAYNDHVVYQGAHTGQWSEGDQLIFSVDGNSYKMNKYYQDGFRINNRFQTGSTSYRPNLEQYNMSVDVHNSSLFFERDTTASDYAQVSVNTGGLGGVDKSTTAWIVHWFHPTGEEESAKRNAVTDRMRTSFAGNADVAYTFIGKDKKKYRQHLYANFGQRQHLNHDQNGLVDEQPLYQANYYTVQADGTLPTGKSGWLDHLGYFVNFSGKQNMGSEFYLNTNEVADLKTYSASLYGKKGRLTTGLTWATNVVRHKDIEFSRNLIDQDGESLEPWYPDGNTHELSWSLTWQKPLLVWLKLKLDCYNSMIRFNPTTETFSNNVYLQHMSADLETPAPSLPLYRYEWETSAFTGGLLENTVGVEANHALSKVVSLRGNLGFTLDGMLLGGGKSRVSPNVQAGVSFDIHPCKWFQMGVSLSHDRISYNIDNLRYFSNDYLNGNVYYAGTDKLFTTTGGKYHDYAAGLMQQSYVTFELPIRFRIHTKRGLHEISLQQTYKKYYHVWQTQFQNGADANGFYEDGNYFLNDGLCNYTVGYIPTDLMGGGFFTNTPYYISQLTRYTFTGKKVLFSLSWQNILGASTVGIGNGPAGNDIGVLSETTANPNTFRVLTNSEGPNQGVGRIDQDKGFVLRGYVAYNICKAVQIGMTFKWTDGQPISYYNTYNYSDAEGNTQVAVVPGCSRGTNPTDANFGCRETAIFNFDLHARAQWKLWNHNMSLSLLCYNAWDFGNVTVEYNFPQGYRGMASRGYSYALTIPRGLITTFKVDL